MTVLADTSVWVEFLRRGQLGRAGFVQALVDRSELVTCGPVAAELLTGADGDRRDELWKRLSALDWAPFDRAEWRRVGEVSGDLRRRGTMVPLTDIVIGVAAEVADAALWSFGAHFDRLGAVMPRLQRFEP